MSIKASTGLRNAILATNSLRGTMNGGFIHIYAGVPPQTADAALGDALLLCTISLNSGSTGLTFEPVPQDGVLFKTQSEVWSGVNVASGVATFYRHVLPGDTGEKSTTDARIQGRCGVAGSDMNLTATALASGATQTVDFYSIDQPTL